MTRPSWETDLYFLSLVRVGGPTVRVVRVRIAVGLVDLAVDPITNIHNHTAHRVPTVHILRGSRIRIGGVRVGVGSRIRGSVTTLVHLAIDVVADVDADSSISVPAFDALACVG
jgi:hypothetical protein